MAYIKTNWVNDETELNAENMNHIEDGIANSQNVELIAISDEAPLECETGDKYYNTEDNLVYTAIGINTWSEDGEEPISGIFYILFSEQSSYSYDGTTLVSVGGGTEDIIISEDAPTTDDWKLWIDTGEIGSAASEITNEYSTSTGKGYSANYVNNLMIPQSYNLTNLPAHSGGTNTYQLNKLNKLVILNVDVIWFDNISANAWLDLGQIPTELYPSKEITSNCAIVNGGNGNVVGNGRIIVTTTGLIRVKSIVSNNDLTGCGCSISWFIN